MENWGDCASPSHDEFLAAIRGEHNPASTAAFTAAILDQRDPAGAAAFAARILGEHNFNPDEPRDEKGRWTTGGSFGASKYGIPKLAQYAAYGNDPYAPYVPNDDDPFDGAETPPAASGGSDGSYDDWPNAIASGAPGPSAMGGSRGKSPAAKPPTGTKENGYNGLGKWGDFKTEKEFFDFLRRLLGTASNNFPDGWKKWQDVDVSA
jgi:hypothetical protein